MSLLHQIRDFLLPADILEWAFALLTLGTFCLGVVCALLAPWRMKQKLGEDEHETPIHRGSKSKLAAKKDQIPFHQGATTLSDIEEEIHSTLHKILEWIPGTLVMLGLLGTFFGLGLAMDTASTIVIEKAGVEEVMGALQEILAHLGTQFKTTVWGIVGALILRAIPIPLLNRMKSREARRFYTRKLYELHEEESERHELKRSWRENTQQTLVGMLDRLRNIQNQVGEFSRVADALKQAASDFEQSTNKAADRLSESAKSLERRVDEFKEGTAKTLNEMKTQLGETMEDLNRAVGNMKTEMGNASSGLERSANSLSNAIKDMRGETTNTLNSVKNEISRAVRDSGQTLEQGTREMSDSIEKALREEMEKFRNETNEEFKRLNKTLDEPIRSLKKYAASLTAVEKQLAQEFSRTNDINKRLTDMMEKMTAAVARAKLSTEKDLGIVNEPTPNETPRQNGDVVNEQELVSNDKESTNAETSKT
jgi:ABC-type transporter Mla subunit MlaD